MDTQAKPSKNKKLEPHEKTRDYTIKLLDWYLDKEQLKIDKMLNRYIISSEFKAIDTKRHIDEIIEQVFQITNLFTCYTNDQRKMRKFQTDPQIMTRITEFF